MIGSRQPAAVSLAAALLFAIAAPAVAEPAPWTVTVVHSGNTKLAVRIGAELSSLGYTVRTAMLPPPISEETLRSLAQEHNATALMQIPRAGNAVQVWIAGRTTGITELRAVSVPAETQEGDSLIAFKAVELLRASLMTLPEAEQEVGQATPPAPPQDPEAEPIPEPEPDPKPQSDPEPPPEPAPDPENSVPSEPIPERALPRLTASLQPAAVFPFGDLHPTFNIGLSIYTRIAKFVGIEITGLIPSFTQTVSVPEGSIDLSAGAITAGFRFNLLPRRFRFGLSVSAVAGPLFVRTRGHGSSIVEDESTIDYSGEDALTVTALIGGLSTLNFDVNDVFSIRTDASCAATQPKPVIRVEHEESEPSVAASYGNPVVTLLFGVEIRLL